MENVNAVMGQALTLTKTEQQELLRQLHDAVYNPSYAPRLSAYAASAPGCATGCPRPCATGQQLRAA
ncbi:MAG: hypothetical protein ACRYFK_14290 [Janthinobacterium lividum]